jgi:hypothetical protein
MNTTEIKELLHNYIEHADDRHLVAIYVLLEKEMNTAHYDSETLAMLYQRREIHRKGESKSYSVDEAFQSIRAQFRK